MIRPDGRVLHTMHLVQVRKPARVDWEMHISL